MVADVPVGVLLSGGLDSSLIVALLAEQGQRGPGDVLDRLPRTSASARATSSSSPTSSPREFGTDHHQIRVGAGAAARRRCREAIAAMSEPMVSHDAVAFYLLSEEVAQHRKVVQSGQGADEVFGGYYWYPPLLEADGRRARRLRGRVLRPRRRRRARAASRPSAAADGDPSRARSRPRCFAAPGARSADRPRRCGSTPR